MYNYLMYGLECSSDIPLFNIPQSSIGHIDVTIHEGAISYENVPDNHRCFYFTPNFAVINFFSGILRIQDGKEIIYEVKENFEHESVTPFIVGWGFAFLLSQRQNSVFHCSALSYGSKGFFVSGVSGAGKSTTALELIKKGCKYLADDIAIVDSYDSMMILPAYPIQKVCPDVSLTLPQEDLYSIKNDRGKYSYLNTEDYCSTPQKAYVLFKLLVDDGDSLKIEELFGVSKYLRIMECLYLCGSYCDTGIPGDEKYRCLKMAEKMRVFSITRPRKHDTLKDITQFILDTIKNMEV